MSARALAAAVALAAVAGCGTTSVHTNAPGGHIYIDGRPYGPYAEMQQIGPPGTATVVVRTDDGRSKIVQTKRRFTLTTALLGFITYGVCWVACWEYPDDLYVEVEPTAAAPAGWSDGGEAWGAPPPGWQEPAPAVSSGQGEAAAPDGAAPGDAAAPGMPAAEPAPPSAAETAPPAGDDPWAAPPSGQR